MARPSPTAPLLLLLSLLAVVAHCRVLESDRATADDADSAAEATTTVAVADETGPPNPTIVHSEPADLDNGFLRLPSHRRHPCRHLWWARHHGDCFGDGHHRFHSRGDAELVRDGEVVRRTEGGEEVKAVAEPDPDRSLTSSDGDDASVKGLRKEEMLWRMLRHSLRHHHHEDHQDEEARRSEAGEEVTAVAEPDPDRSLTNSDDAAVKGLRKEDSLWRMLRHSHRHHHHEDGEDEADHHERREEEGTVAGVKRFRRHHHHDERTKEEEDEEEEEKKVRKLFHHDEDDEEKVREEPFHPRHAEDEDDDLEEVVRRFRKVIMRRRFHHGRFFRHHLHGRRHHHHHHGAEEAEEQQHEGGGVVTWIKGLIMNRF